MRENTAERTIDTAEASRAKRLRALTQDVHERLDSTITLAPVLTTIEGYGRFVSMQYLFHRDIDPLYRDGRLQMLIPDLAGRRRLPLLERDLADLRPAEPSEREAPLFRRDAPVDVGTALGWLYVAEGSNLGASLLRREVAKIGMSDTHGARHLAPAPEGPAAHWRSFTESLNAAPLTGEEDAGAAAGALAAFAHVQALADVCLF